MHCKDLLRGLLLRNGVLCFHRYGMLVYFGIFCFFTLISAVDILLVSNKSKQNVLFFLIVITVFFVGGRYWCDNDFQNYVTFFEETPSIAKTSISELFRLYLLWQVEPGYIFSCSFFKLLGLGYQSIFFLCSMLTFILVVKYFQKASAYPILSFFLFFTTLFTLPFVQMRFGVATACVCYALVQLDSQNKKGYWKWMIIGLLFHMTALIGFVIYWIYKIELTRKRSFVLLICSFAFSLIPIKVIFINVLSILGFDRYLRYADSDSSGLVSLVFLFILLFPFIYYEPVLKKKITHYHLLAVMGLSTLLIGCVTREVPILNRFSLLLSVSYCAIIPSYFTLMKKNGTIFCSWVLLVAYAFLKFLPSLNHIQNYQNFLFK